ncbi:MAG: DNA polymerase IV [Arachnia propionica]|nr:MAG: DNA polymerase IV [Arachnia propionica]
MSRGASPGWGVTVLGMAASILHLDLDAFFAAVEQRDKPSLRGKPVVVGGTRQRGVVATASYEARRFGVRSAMSASEARRRCPQAAFLSGRFEAYRQSSRIVMSLLREISPVVEPMGFDEAYVDLAAADWPPGSLPERVSWLRAELTRRTAGLTASVGVGGSKLIAKLASEAAKPDGFRLIEPEEEVDFMTPLPIRAVPGVGPVTEQRLAVLGVATVTDARKLSRAELVRELGGSTGALLHDLVWARDDRPVSAERETKSISTEDTFATDLTTQQELVSVLVRDAAQVAKRLAKAGLFARTITIKIRFADFTTLTKSRSLSGATDREEVIRAIALELASGIETGRGIRLAGVGVAGLSEVAQEQLFVEEPTAGATQVNVEPATVEPVGRGFATGKDVVHDEFGRGWVWGSGHGLVTVRFETRLTPPGPIRTFAIDDPALQLISDLLDLP